MVHAWNIQKPAPEAEGGGPTEPSLLPRSHLPELQGHWSGEIIPRPLRLLPQRENSPNVSDERGLIERIWPGV